MKVLSIQSHVAYGHVGNSAAVFPLQRLGHEVWPVLTVNFSNHTGYGAWRGPLIPADDVREVIVGIEERGAFASCDAILSGYQGSPEIADVIVDAVARVKAANPAATYTCDPVMGNATSGCFVNPAIPPKYRSTIIPVADVLTPNQFELGFITDRETLSDASALDDILSAVDEVRGLGPSTVLVTSVDPRGCAGGRDRDAGCHRRRRLAGLDSPPADEGQRLRRHHRGAVHRPPPRVRLRIRRAGADRLLGLSPCLQRPSTRASASCRLIAAQDAIAAPACEFEVEQVR